jgi:hypothetical protein
MVCERSIAINTQTQTCNMHTQTQTQTQTHTENDHTDTKHECIPAFSQPYEQTEPSHNNNPSSAHDTTRHVTTRHYTSLRHKHATTLIHTLLTILLRPHSRHEHPHRSIRWRRAGQVSWQDQPQPDRKLRIYGKHPRAKSVQLGAHASGGLGGSKNDSSNCLRVARRANGHGC